MKRRNLIKNIALSSGALAVGGSLANCKETSSESSTQKVNVAPGLKGNIKQSVCQWCYGSAPIEELCERASDMGILSIDLVGVKDWSTLKKYNLTSAMGNAPWMSLTDGFADKKNHADLQAKYLELIPQAADHGIKNIICFSGNRTDKLNDEEGLENCAVGLEPLLKVAKDAGVTMVMELLNSKVDHKGYMCDHTEWGAALCEKLGMDNFKLLYDIYHMQIMEGDVIATLTKHKDYIAHYHTAGVPGRNEIDESQELYYPAIMKAILATGFDGYVAQEFIPTKDDPWASLKDSVRICDV